MLHKKSAFTLAEALLTLGILGIVAMMTVPAIIANYQDHMLSASSKAISLEVINGLKMLESEDERLNKQKNLTRYIIEDDGGKTANGEHASMSDAFVFEKLASYLKVGSICSSDAFNLNNSNAKTACGFRMRDDDGNEVQIYQTMEDENGDTDSISIIEKIKDEQNADWAQNPSGIVLANGASLLVSYNSNCQQRPGRGNNSDISEDNICVSIVYDVNGLDAPNQFGKDIGVVSAFYPRNSRFAAPVLYKDSIAVEANQTGNLCKDIPGNKNATRPNLEEVVTLHVYDDLGIVTRSTSNSLRSAIEAEEEVKQAEDKSRRNGERPQQNNNGANSTICVLR